MAKIIKSKDIGGLIRAKRKRKKLSQQELADVCGVGRRFVSELEVGKKERFDLGLTLRILQRLGFEVSITDKDQA